MTDTAILRFSFPAIARKKVTADFDGGRLTSDGGYDGAWPAAGIVDRQLS